jgi:hypothetical protein
VPRYRLATALGDLTVLAVGIVGCQRESGSGSGPGSESGSEAGPGPFPPQYSVAPFMEDPGTCPFPSGSEGVCYEVYTDATSEKSLTYITKQVAADRWRRSVDVEVEFHHSPDGHQFAEGNFSNGVVDIVYTGG